MNDLDHGESWLADHLRHAAAELRATMTGALVPGWGGRSVSAAVEVDSTPRWLRIVTDDVAWTGEPFWTGNNDANALTDVPKPTVITAVEYTNGRDAFKAELMSYQPGAPCSATPELRHDPELAAPWWDHLGSALTTVEAAPTGRICLDQDTLTRRLRLFWGEGVDPHVPVWSTAHGDLHWANLFQPQLGIVDWEGWGTAPAGYDAATLHACSLLVPNTAAHVRHMFGDRLDTPSGRRAELYAIARLLLHSDHGEHPDLVVPLHRRADAILTELNRTHA